MSPETIFNVQISAKPIIAGKDLVGAFANLDHDRSGITCKFRNVVERNANRIGDRFVLMIDKFGQELLHVFAANHDFVMIGSETF